MKMLELIEQLKAMPEKMEGFNTEGELVVLNTRKLADALAKSLRNCDIGTAEEQEERYIKLKREHIDKLARCPAVGQSFFPDSLYWAQMPYEKGDEE